MAPLCLVCLVSCACGHLMWGASTEELIGGEVMGTVANGEHSYATIRSIMQSRLAPHASTRNMCCKHDRILCWPSFILRDENELL